MSMALLTFQHSIMRPMPDENRITHDLPNTAPSTAAPRGTLSCCPALPMTLSVWRAPLCRALRCPTLWRAGVRWPSLAGVVT